MDEKPVTTGAVEAVLVAPPQGPGAEADLARRHGAGTRFSAKAAEINRFLRGQLDATRTHELSQQMLAAGLPI